MKELAVFAVCEGGGGAAAAGPKRKRSGETEVEGKLEETEVGGRCSSRQSSRGRVMAIDAAH